MRKTLAALCGFFIACGIAQAQNSSGTQTLTVANAGCVSGSCVQLKFDSNDVASATISLSGSFTATVQFEASNDGLALTDANKVWVAIGGTPLNGSTAVSSATTANTWKFNVAANTDIRARCSAFTSAPTVVIKSSKGDPASVGAGAATTTSGTASAVTQAGYPMICDTATSGTVTAGQAQMVRCNTGGVLATAISGTVNDGAANSNAFVLADVLGAGANSAGLRVTPNVFNGSTWDHQFYCSKVAKLSALAAATTQIVALVASQKIRVCNMSISNNNATATTLKMVEGTGSNCGTGQADVTSLWNIGATTTTPIFMHWGNDGAIITTTAADALCFTSSAASSLEITITYDQH